MIQWVESAGGPLLLAPIRALRSWKGVDGRGGNTLEERRDIVANSDYDLACSARGYLEHISLDDEAGLVFGDEPHRTTWIPDPLCGRVVRWIYANHEAEILRCALIADTGNVEQPPIRFSSRGGEFLILDSAYPGECVDATNSLMLTIPPGDYLVSSEVCKPNAETAFLLHRFAPQTSADT